MSQRIILGVNVTSFSKNSNEIQEVLSEYGCSIRTRLGLHEAAENICAPNGLILLDFIGGLTKADEITAKLNTIQGVEVKRMVF
jgi:hypothetical protein